tara:strand:+ start:42 stop:374 length:333 start_codon:yes stop_codon:yes gene_type:complete
MNIGALDRRIVVEKNTSTANDYGELVAGWAVYCTVWAGIDRKPYAREGSSGEQIISFQSVTFNIRSSNLTKRIEPSYRVLYDSKYYNILGVQEVGRQEQLRLVTELRDTL